MLWENSSVVVAAVVVVLARYVRLQSDNSLSLCSLLGTWTENVASVLIKILANGDYYISIIINYFYRTILKIDVWGNFLYNFIYPFAVRQFAFTMFTTWNLDGKCCQGLN